MCAYVRRFLRIPIIPSSELRLMFPERPGSPFLPGSKMAIHCLSESTSVELMATSVQSFGME